MTLGRFLPWRWNTNTTKAVENLQVVLETALSCAIFYPRVVERLRAHDSVSAAPAQGLLEWGPRVMAAADKLGSVISQLGGNPRWNVDCRPDEIEPPNYCGGQVTRLERAVEMLEAIIPTIADGPVRTELKTVVSDFNSQLQILRGLQEYVESSW